MSNPPLHIVVRVLLPDRPGALGAIASRIAAAQGDIVGVDVLERSGTVAVDEFAVDVPSETIIPLLVREIEAVEGAAVEEARVVDAHPIPLLDALATAEALVRVPARDALFAELVALVTTEFDAEWAALVGADDVLASSGLAPETQPLLALRAGVAASPAVASGSIGPSDLLVAPLEHLDASLLVSRSGRPFRQIERGQCNGLARITDVLAQRSL